jgi:CMP-N-acetylneuraminic acid synthetase
MMNEKLNVLAVIPARGGSKGIPGKNIRDLSGKPLVAYSIEAALQSKTVQRIAVSTDDQKIADISISFGAEVIYRPADISGDMAASELALLHVLDILRQREGYCPDLLVFLQCTCPLTLPEDIDGTVQILLEENADSAFAASSGHYLLWSKLDDGNMVGINHNKNKRLMRQQVDNQFVETGAVYVMRVDGFLTAKNRFFGKTVGYELPRERFCDIDTPVDFLLAEQLMIWRDKQKNSLLKRCDHD